MYTRLVLVCSFPPIPTSPPPFRPLYVPRANTVSSPSFATLRLFIPLIATPTFQCLWSFSFLVSILCVFLMLFFLLLHSSRQNCLFPPSFIHSIYRSLCCFLLPSTYISPTITSLLPFFFPLLHCVFLHIWDFLPSYLLHSSIFLSLSLRSVSPPVQGLYRNASDCIFKLLSSPGIDSKE